MKEIISGSFEWNAEKNRANKEKHGIGFEEAIKAFEEPYLRVLSRYPTETRWIALGRSENKIIAVIYTERNGRNRIISARMARRHEREIYEDRIGGPS